MSPFITGSRCYGTPNEDSDIDLVLRVSIDDAFVLIAHSDDPPPDAVLEHYGVDGLKTVRYGELNLLLCANDSTFHAWKVGTDACREKREKLGRPLTRVEAIEIFQAVFKIFQDAKA